MAPNLHLDFTTEAYSTDDTGKLITGMDGAPTRQAQDVASNETYVQVCKYPPTDTTNPKDARRKLVIDQLLVEGILIPVSGHGVWCKQVDAPAVLNSLK
jgi:hypothetical protein